MKQGDAFAGVVIVFIICSVAFYFAGPGTKPWEAWNCGAMQKCEQQNPQSSLPPAAGGGTSVVGSPTISAQFINQVLSNAGSPAAGTGQALYDLGVQYGIDPAYALAVFQKESNHGKYGAAFENHSLGNIICAGYPTCHGRFRSYPSWIVGYEDFYRLIKNEYLSRGLTTVEAITPIYAPPRENNTNGYIATVCQTMAAYRQGIAA